MSILQNRGENRNQKLSKAFNALVATTTTCTRSESDLEEAHGLIYGIIVIIGLN